jgi:DNA-binding SARP family transcriptional activator
MTRGIIVGCSATGACPVIHLRSLGACEINVGGTRLVPTAQTLFAGALYLAVEGARPIPREQLLTLLWPDADEEKGTHSLRQMFYKLRTHGVTLDSDAERVVLPPGMVTTDYDTLLAPTSVVPVEQLLERIPGGFLPGYMPRASRPFAEWVEAQRAVVNAALRRQIVVGINQLKTVGDWPATYALAQRCLELDPLNEEATLALAEAMAMDGSKARAIMIIDRYMNEVGPRAPQLHLPATMLKKRISELYPLPPVIERDPPQTGREAEMEKLDAALKDARQGSGSAFVISGPPGIGKTRLVTEFTRAAQLQGIPIARTGMGQHDNHRPLGAWSDLVPLLQRMPGALGCDPESLPYLKRLTTYDSKQTTPSPEAQDAEYLFARIRMSIIDLVSAVASESCLIVLIEDIHWMDEWSWDVMSALTKRLDKTGMLILMTRRDTDEQATPMPKDSVTRGMPLAPLDEARCRKLFGLVGSAKREIEEDFVEWCVRTSAGNPYFLIELGRRALRTDGKFQAPPSLTRLIAERFLDVAPMSRRVLQAAAVLGKNSTLSRIEKVLDEKRIGLLDSLDELSRHSLVVMELGRVVCRHDLLGVSALTDISPLSLRLLHRHAAETLESEDKHASEREVLWDAAEHWATAGETAHAVELLDNCASRAMETGAPTRAARVLEFAMSLLPPGAYRDTLRIRLIHALYFAREFWGLVELLKAQRERGSRDHEARINHSPEELFELDATLFTIGPSRELLLHAFACASDVAGSPEHRVRAGLIGLKAAVLSDDRRTAKRIYAGVQSALRDAPAAVTTEFRTIYEGSFGSVSASSAEARKLLALVEDAPDPVLKPKALLQCVVALVFNGDMEDAKKLAMQARDLALGMQLAGTARAATELLVEISCFEGDYEQVERTLESLALVGGPGDGYSLEAVNRDLARLALTRGDVDRAGQILGSFDDFWGGGMPRQARAITELRMRYSLRAKKDSAPSDLDMKRLLAMHRRGRRHSNHDRFVSMLLEAHSARREYAAAAQLADRYVRFFRRERCPLALELRQAIGKLATMRSEAEAGES